MRSRAGTREPVTPELGEHGLLLWRLRKRPCPDMWCLVARVPGGYALAVDWEGSGSAGPAIAERLHDVSSVVRRSDALKAGFLGGGWWEIDVK